MKRAQHIFASSFGVQRSLFVVQGSTLGVECSPTPKSSFLTPNSSARTRAEAGATLLVTLGILTILSVMVVTFLLAARYQSLSSKHFRDKTVARQALDVALVRAMQFADSAMIASNYNHLASVPASAESNRRRVSPVGRWYSKDYDTENRISSRIDYQAQDVLLVPVTNDNAQTVDLLTDEVRRLLPPALTNHFGNAERPLPLSSGWITDLNGGIRVSFAVLNCSGFIDAHCYDSVSNLLVVTTQHVSRAYFSQQDLLRDTSGAAHEFVNDPGKTSQNPFFITSYDPNPNVTPLNKDGVQVSESLGTHGFNPAPKFDINSITNQFLTVGDVVKKKRLVVMPRSWFNNVTNLLQSASIANLQDKASWLGRDAYFGDPKKTAWNIVNYMTESRIPTAFPDNVFESNTASRLDYAIEDVPLINEVELKDIFKTSVTKDDYGNADSTLYGSQLARIDTQLRTLFAVPVGETAPTVDIYWSNIYAFDVELWYPFKPLPVPMNAYLWLSVTTNSPPAFAVTQSPYGWLDETNDTLGHVLFSRWNTLYELISPSNTTLTVTNDVVWNVIQTNAVLLTYVEHPDAFDTASNQTAIADAFSYLWLLTYTNDTLSVTNTQPFTYVLQNTTLPYTNRITQAVLATNLLGVTAVLETPYNDLVDWGDATSWARYFQKLFNASASQFSEYEKYEILPEWFTDTQEYHVFNSTNLVYFPYVVTNLAANGTDVNSITIRFSALAGENNKSGPPTDNCAAWLRPMVTVSEIDLPVLNNDANGIPEVVDEALLIRNGTKDTGYYKRWDKPGSISFSDPRDNAWYDPDLTNPTQWKEYAEGIDTMDGGNGAINENCNVAEHPFIHYDRPFLSIGELGYINVDLTNRFGVLPHPSGKDIRRDTIDFSTRSGASLIDKFCVGSVSNATKGLVQANTTQGEVVRRIMNKIQLGWPKLWVNYQAQGYNDNGKLLNIVNDGDTDNWVDHWTNTLFKAYAPPANYGNSGLPGWTCFAEMLPDLSTNALSNGMVQIPSPGDPNADTHDYLEDVMRGIVDKVSFRQNIYVIIVAAQSLSPASTEDSPIVLADQRAAVTVIRDAFTGRWLIHSWVWLTE